MNRLARKKPNHWLAVAIVVVVMAGVMYRLAQLSALNHDGPLEAENRIVDHPELLERIGEHRRYGTVLHGTYDLWTPGGGMMEAYVPVRGTKSFGVVYIRAFNDVGVWKLRELKYRQNGQKNWTAY